MLGNRTAVVERANRLEPLEPLESRRLMAVAASFAANTLFVYGDNAANDIHVTQVGSNISVQSKVGAGYVEVYKTPLAGVLATKIYARAGNDRVEVDFGVGGDTLIQGGLGADWLKAGGGNCTVYGNAAPGSSEAVFDDNASDTLIAGASLQLQLHGQGGDDRFYSSLPGYSFPLYNGREVMKGGAGNDRFFLGSGRRRSEVEGEAGNDTFYVNGLEEMWLDGGAGVDKADFSDYGTSVTVANDGVKGSGVSAFPGSRRARLEPDVEAVVGTPFDDVIVLGNQDNVVYAGGGDDRVETGFGDDTVYGGKGNDTLLGQGDDDKLYGQSGDDSLVGGDGRDLLVGGAGSDQFNSKDGSVLNDVLYGGNQDGTDLAGTDIAIIDKVSQASRDTAVNMDGIV